MATEYLRVASMNLENLFSPGVNFYGNTYSPEEYEAKVKWIGQQLARCDAHVIALTELGDDPDACLQDLVQHLSAADETGWLPFSHHFAGAPALGSTKIRNGVISRFPITEFESVIWFPDGFLVDMPEPTGDWNSPDGWVAVPVQKFTRPFVRVRIEPGGSSPAFNLIVVHLKSKRPKTASRDGYNRATGIVRSAIQRNVEAAALRVYLDEFLPQQFADDERVPTLVAGDLNATPNAVPTQNIRGPFDKVPGAASTWSEPDKRRLLNCARLHMKFAAYGDKLYSYVYDEDFSLLDQLLVTEHLATKFRRLEVYNDHVLRHAESGRASEERWKSKVSDHGIVLVELKWNVPV